MRIVVIIEVADDQADEAFNTIEGYCQKWADEYEAHEDGTPGSIIEDFEIVRGF